MSLVLDCSATLAWIYDDESTADTRQLLDAVTESGAIVPSLWRLEIANSLLMAVKRGRISAAFRNGILAHLGRLSITIDPETDSYAWSTTLHLAERFGLTSYDAAYLELAQRRALPLATLDRELRGAAAILGVPLLGLPT